MSKTTDKLVKQHEVIGVKTDCKYFSNVGNLCSRVENGMMRCDEYLECEFKYIDALKEENAKLKEKIIELSEEKGKLIVDNNTLKEENDRVERNILEALNYENKALNEAIKYKQTLQEIKQITKNQDLYRGRQALATKILQTIGNTDIKESEM